MKRIFLGVITALLAVFGMSAGVQAANTDNFTISKFDAEYTLGRDSENRSTLQATWRITANFPPNQNRGIAPIFVKEYDGHPTSFELKSVTDENGNQLNYNWNGNELRIGDKDVYVEGQKTYVIQFSQRDVTKHYADTGKDEFYWDVIGVDWRVPIAKATIRLKVEDSITSSIKSDLNCYIGSMRSTNKCTASSLEGDYLISVSNLAKRQGVTIALGFEQGSFKAYEAPWWLGVVEAWVSIQRFLFAATIVVIIWLVYRRRKLSGRSSDMGTIVPEFIPPKDTSIAVSAYILRRHDTLKGSAATAQLLDLAVRHFIKIHQTSQAKIFRSAKYEIEIVKNLTTLRAEERELLQDMFEGGLPKIGDRLDIAKLKNNSSFLRRMADNDKKLERLVESRYGLYEKRLELKRSFRRCMKVLLFMSGIMLSPMLFGAAMVALVMSNSTSLTDKGLDLRRYLAGLKMYIGMAEAERLAMLQSPEGAEKIKVNINDETQLVKLYEQNLPYAVLFGQEKEWSKTMGKYYEQAGAQPDWYIGQGTFNAVAFATGMSGLSSAASQASSYSSSTGGSTGGGFSGGGGGGGGGGGW